MVKQYSQLYLEARRALLATEDQQSASLLARNLLCHVSGKTQEQVIAGRDLFANEAVCQAMEQALTAYLQENTAQMYKVCNPVCPDMRSLCF